MRKIPIVVESTAFSYVLVYTKHFNPPCLDSLSCIKVRAWGLHSSSKSKAGERKNPANSSIFHQFSPETEYNHVSPISSTTKILNGAGD